MIIEGRTIKNIEEMLEFCNRDFRHRRPRRLLRGYDVQGNPSRSGR